MQSTPTTIYKISNKEIAFFDRGRGEAVLLVHGITTYSFIWRKVVPLLQKNYRVLGIDLPGCGSSSKSVDN